MLASGIGALAADYLWQTTAEGDFIIMLNQTARFLVKQIDAAIADPEKDPLVGAFKHYATIAKKDFSLEKLAKIPAPTFSSARDAATELNKLQLLFEYRALTEVRRI